MDVEQPSRVGALLRDWRRRRRFSQLDLALLAETSARHLSCVETGRARPSRTMLLRLSTALEIPLRERNTLLLAADYAPAYRESSLDDQYMASVRSALDAMLAAHEPYPAVVVDRCWNVLTGNDAMSLFMDGIPSHLLEPAPNVFRLALHPDGLAPHMVNIGEVRSLFLERLLRQVNATGDPELRALHEEVCRYPAPAGEEAVAEPDVPASQPGPIQVPLRIRTPHGELSMFTTMATFGAPADVTLSELAIELFYPLDEFTTKTLRELAAPPGPEN
ncbi:XRE family transcriptional regulator [Streptomyces abyssalis]|uniref:XRE family transcriptional regulator n=1 Tax=Streptomyces abyssalis TaxID=933944 RepID=A0A1E7JKT3_9ACTN|nr:helix-turn-helix transcriptional regulator [Streptomyces abyssalis]OEU88253.1 XRE family transcriptional regulator [Streptomyces abyssalis]OEU91123.1 XRE family transcriptional regulator [Streptomyces abyssalis]OEV30834.1 XRE family transcriptional regulator [Streptomyces nanshensis]